MLNRIRDQIGTAGLIVAVVALVAALAGGAFAAAGGLTAKEKKQVKAIAKGLVGTGPAGPQGPAGPAGANGKDGAPGLDGRDGADGADGADGRDGSPWTAGGVLPTGATLTGTFARESDPERPMARSAPAEFATASFPIPVRPAPTFVFVPHDPMGAGAGNDSIGGGHCDGVVGGVPQADPGFFCVYAVSATVGPFVVPGVTVETTGDPLVPSSSGPVVGTTGTILKLACPDGGAVGGCIPKGVWAVTA